MTAYSQHVTEPLVRDPRIAREIYADLQRKDFLEKENATLKLEVAGQAGLIARQDSLLAIRQEIIRSYASTEAELEVLKKENKRLKAVVTERRVRQALERIGWLTVLAGIIIL